MAYATFTFYRDIFKGVAITDEERFVPLAERASEYIDYITFERAADNGGVDAIKRACCAIVDVYDKYENGGGVVSEKVGNHTINYAVGVSTMKTEDQKLYDVAYRYLIHTGLLYMGVT